MPLMAIISTMPFGGFLIEFGGGKNPIPLKKCLLVSLNLATL
jgi:hypothetical protein